jgi:hypothetical protein
MAPRPHLGRRQLLVGPSAELGVIWARARLGAYVDVTDGRYRLAPNVGFAIGW